MPAQRIILLRHAEKPSVDGRIGGVDARGRTNDDELSVRGWQRAGALARLFAPGGGDLGVPDALFAAGPSAERPSRRAVSTLEPLAGRLGRPLRLHLGKGQEAALAREAAECEGLVLVAWDHRGLPVIAQALLTGTTTAPSVWPSTCFDRFWVFSRRGGSWDFESSPQQLLAGDD